MERLFRDSIFRIFGEIHSFSSVASFRVVFSSRASFRAIFYVIVFGCWLRVVNLTKLTSFSLPPVRMATMISSLSAVLALATMLSVATPSVAQSQTVSTVSR